MKISVENLDDLAGADVCAVATLDTLGNIDLCEVILNNDCVSRAFLLALHAADAACVADLHDNCALVAAGACGHNVLVVRNELDDLLGAGIGACAAAYALLAVNLCNAVDNFHCAELAGIDTVAETDAGEAAIHVALAAEQHCSLAVLGSLVVEALDSLAFLTGAGYESDHLDSIACGNAHDFGDFCSACFASGNALVYRCFALGDSGGIAVTACKAAAAAVCTCEALTDSSLLGVNFNIENLGGNSQDSAEDCAHNAENENS